MSEPREAMIEIYTQELLDGRAAVAACTSLRSHRIAEDVTAIAEAVLCESDWHPSWSEDAYTEA